MFESCSFRRFRGQTLRLSILLDAGRRPALRNICKIAKFVDTAENEPKEVFLIWKCFIFRIHCLAVYGPAIFFILPMRFHANFEVQKCAWNRDHFTNGSCSTPGSTSGSRSRAWTKTFFWCILKRDKDSKNPGSWENKKIAGPNFCTDRQTMAIFH